MFSFKAVVAVTTGVIIGVPAGVLVAGIAVAILFMFVFQNFRPVSSHLAGGRDEINDKSNQNRHVEQMMNSTSTAHMTNSYKYDNQMELNEIQQNKTEYRSRQEEVDAMMKPKVKKEKELRF